MTTYPGSTNNGWWQWHALGLLIALTTLGIVLYLQVVEFIMPCFFCIYLRLIIIAYGLTSFIAILHKPAARGRKIYQNLFMLYCLLGILLSGYLVWLQMQPAERVIICRQGAGAGLIGWPFGKMLVLLFASYGSCSDIPWTWSGFSLPLISLSGFLGLLMLEMSKYCLAARNKHQDRRS